MEPKITHYRLKLYPEGTNDDEIDRAMTLMIDALAYREAAQEIKEKENARWGCEPIDYDREFEVIIRYLEKVEQELEANNE